jgi:hypothetical protein
MWEKEQEFYRNWRRLAGGNKRRCYDTNHKAWDERFVSRKKPKEMQTIWQMRSRQQCER